MPSTPSSAEPGAESKFLPADQYPTPLDSAGDVTKCSKHEGTDCNPMSSVPPKASFMPTPEDLFCGFPLSPPTTIGGESSVSSPSFLPPGLRPALGKQFTCICGHYTSNRSYSILRHQSLRGCTKRREGKEEDPMSEATRESDSTNGLNQDIHKYTNDSLSRPGSVQRSSDNLQIPTQGGEYRPQIRSPKHGVKSESPEDIPGYLDALCSPEPGPSSANEEKLDQDSSPKPDSDESSSITDICVDNQKSLMVEKIVFVAAQWLRLKLDAWRKNAGDNSKNAPRTSEALSGSHLPSEPSNTINCGNKKRKATERESYETDNEGEDGNREDQGGSGMFIQQHENLKYACPYFKYNPAKYKDWRTCPGPGWNDVHRVKEHLYRRHKQPQYRCARCWQPFTDQQGLTHHQRADEPCPLREMGYVEGFDATQERNLRSRKRASQKLSETEKWKRVFKILFPHVLFDDIPSPFYDYSQVSQKEDAYRHPESGSLAQYEQYMLREVPQRLRQVLGRELDRDLTVVEENLRRRAGDCFRTLIEEAFQELRQIRRLGSPGQGPEASNDMPALAEGPQLLVSELPSGEGANPHFEGQGEAWPNNFDLDSFDPSSLPEELQFSFDNGDLIEDLLRPGEDGAGEATKQSDSGYVSNSPG